ncbi:Bax inhibitor-1/YccA family protein [Chromobacterium sp. IIBBL 290-4]|uniref:Bax inhibitor-1/YccA family protein n=1 Tax=Chromobacterium sp. IIBBL 290-4 TaxID=2953890 RepID=UPI0020B76346|nr:Bax inhibitor-1/YccA family protein [Chromobacterium sp. IIBBL 290-4]UTH73742.1 Bax inhibitor-1/YccA family protein [Chromobacterium sp. IIBBL 290-4]
MHPNLESAYQSTSMADVRHKVLRNTYGLLGLSMIPTVMGAIVGTNMNFSFMKASPIMGFVLMMAVFYGLVFAIEKNRYSSVGVFLMLGFTFLMGVLLGPLLQFALKFSNGGQLIMTAGAATSAVFFVMAGIASTTKRDLSGLGSFLTVGAVVLMIAVVANVFLRMPGFQLMLSAAFALFSSLMILWQVKVVVDGGENSYISAALSIYISIYNLFTSLLQLLLAFAGNRD